MAAGALAWLKSGSSHLITQAAAMALKSLLGLVCDPVAGLVEVPCVKRNASGAMNALCAVDMALAGIESAIPADEVIDAMREIGDLMHKDLGRPEKADSQPPPPESRWLNVCEILWNKVDSRCEIIVYIIQFYSIRIRR